MSEGSGFARLHSGSVLGSPVMRAKVPCLAHDRRTSDFVRCHHRLKQSFDLHFYGIIALGADVLSVKPCHSLISSFSTSATIWCCFTTLIPLKASDSTLMLYMVPQPPLMSRTSALLRGGSSCKSLDSRFFSTELLPALSLSVRSSPKRAGLLGCRSTAEPQRRFLIKMDMIS